MIIPPSTPLTYALRLFILNLDILPIVTNSRPVPNTSAVLWSISFPLVCYSINPSDSVVKVYHNASALQTKPLFLAQQPQPSLIFNPFLRRVRSDYLPRLFSFFCHQPTYRRPTCIASASKATSLSHPIPPREPRHLEEEEFRQHNTITVGPRYKKVLQSLSSAHKAFFYKSPALLPFSFSSSFILQPFLRPTNKLQTHHPFHKLQRQHPATVTPSSPYSFVRAHKNNFSTIPPLLDPNHITFQISPNGSRTMPPRSSPPRTTHPIPDPCTSNELLLPYSPTNRVRVNLGLRD